MNTFDFLPVSKADMEERGWWYYDFLVVTADAYIDHPSFGSAIIARVLEDEGFRVAVLAQPDWHSADAFRAMGKPRYGVMIGGGNIDSMVAHYTAAKKRRSADAYSPGNRMGLRPDRPTIVYANRAREAFPGVPIVIGGLEGSLRRFAHYDYWDDKVRRSILFDAQADLLVYGMGERATRQIARRLSRGEDVSTLTDIRGTAFAGKPEDCAFPAVTVPSFEAVVAGKQDYALATKIENEEHDPIRGKAILQPHGDQLLIVNPPQMPLDRQELDHIYELPYAREVHPMYDAQDTGKGIPQSIVHCLEQEEEAKRQDMPVSRENQPHIMGMRITGQIIRLHGGRVDFKKRESGTFDYRFWLPVQTETGIYKETGKGVSGERVG